MTDSNIKIDQKNPVIRLIGVGETGVKLVETLAMIGLTGVESYSLDTDNRSLSRCHQSKSLLLGNSIPCGLGTGGDVALARAAVESDRDQLSKLVLGSDLVFVIAGMGGGTGTEAAPYIARLAKDAGALVVSVAATPFKCEGSRRCNKATGGIRDLKESSDVVFHFSNEEVMQITGDKISLNCALDIANQHLCESVLGLSRMLIEPGLLNVSFADLQSAMRGRHSLGSIIYVEGSGKDRAKDAIEKILAHPEARGGEVFGEAKTLLVHLSGGATLSIAEMNGVIDFVNLHASDNNLVVGASGPGKDDALQITLVIVHDSNSHDSFSEIDVSKMNSESNPSDLGFPENFMPSGDASYEGLATGSAADNRGGFAYTPPAPSVESITPDIKHSLLETAAKQETSRKKRKEIRQEMLPLEIVSKGRFEKSEPTIHKGEDLDQPTYIRRGMMLN